VDHVRLPGAALGAAVCLGGARAGHGASRRSRRRPGRPDDRHKDIFARWLARGYTRLELSDELGRALEAGKFKQAIDNLVKRHERQIFGVFFELTAFN